MADLELIALEAKEIMDDCIKRIRQHRILARYGRRYDELVRVVDQEIGNFNGYWETMYEWVTKKFGDEAAKRFREEMIIYHYNKTKHKGFEAALGSSICSDMDYEEYMELIKRKCE